MLLNRLHSVGNPGWVPVRLRKTRRALAPILLLPSEKARYGSLAGMEAIGAVVVPADIAVGNVQSVQSPCGVKLDNVVFRHDELQPFAFGRDYLRIGEFLHDNRFASPL
jgi:hypothetical protein